MTYGRITVRSQKSRWGSCSGKGNLNFNCLLMLAPPAVQDYVVVHELLHIIVRLHNEQFKSLLTHYLPNWRQTKEELNRCIV